MGRPNARVRLWEVLLGAVGQKVLEKGMVGVNITVWRKGEAWGQCSGWDKEREAMRRVLPIMDGRAATGGYGISQICMVLTRGI